MYVMLANVSLRAYHLRILSLAGGLTPPPINRVLAHDLSTSLDMKIMARTSNGRGG